MPIHIETIESEVAVEPAAAAPSDSAQQAMEWQERARIAAHVTRLLRDELRTRARGYDD
jgi:hypothetical protein